MKITEGLFAVSPQKYKHNKQIYVLKTNKSTQEALLKIEKYLYSNSFLFFKENNVNFRITYNQSKNRIYIQGHDEEKFSLRLNNDKNLELILVQDTSIDDVSVFNKLNLIEKKIKTITVSEKAKKNRN